MKITTKLSIIFSIIASVALVIFGVLVYLFTINHSDKVFQELLSDRVTITEKLFLEKESFSAIELEKIKDQFLRALPEETEEVIELKNDVMPVFKYNYSDNNKQQLIVNESYSFQEGNMTGVSNIFNVNKKRYLIIVTAVDVVGIQNLVFLRVRIIILILIVLPLLFITSFVVTKRALRPLTNKIHHANAISASNLYERLQIINPNDEIGELAIAFNKLLDRLEASFKSQKSFISNASHEIRNPLTAIMGEAEITGAKLRSTEEYAESLKTILQEAERLSLTVNNLLELSKVRATEEDIKFEILQFDDFLEEIKTSFDFFSPENKVSISIAKTQSGIYSVSINKNLMKTALFNLLDNACKFSSNKPVEIKLVKVGNWLSLAIEDNGLGITEKDLLQIKEPFYRGENTLHINGSGIGLALCEKIITLNNGTLTIDSVLNNGTKVIIMLPFQST
ncbi:MAG: HAMP domain-containing histidine kinase [Flavobacteriales bacterium]|nr:HAMP domain-containing histidine kinase [Flavobacteriales bacterium]